jgi:hypothetical protein
MLACRVSGIFPQRQTPSTSPKTSILRLGACPQGAHNVASKTSRKTTTRRTAPKSMKKAPSRSSRARANKAENTTPVGDEEVSIDRRRSERRDGAGGSEEKSSAAPQLERRQKVNRRRQIDPTTCERDYTDQEVEFMNALDDYKRKSGRMFPTCSEVLEVLRSLGYVKLSASEMSAMAIEGAAASAKPMSCQGPAVAVGCEVITTATGESQLFC